MLQVQEYEQKEEKPVHNADSCLDIETAFDNISKTLFNTTNNINKSDIDISQIAKENGKGKPVQDLTNDKKLTETQKVENHKDTSGNNLGVKTTHQIQNKSLNGTEINNGINGLTNTTINATTIRNNPTTNHIINKTGSNVHPLQIILDKVEATSNTSAEKLTRSSAETSGEFQTRRKKRKNRRYMKTMVQILNQMLNEDHNGREESRNLDKHQKDKEASKKIDTDGKGREEGNENKKDNVEKLKNETQKEENKKNNTKGNGLNKSKENGEGSETSKTSNNKKPKSNNKRRQEKSKQRKEDVDLPN